jgi:hypothetical protein
MITHNQENRPHFVKSTIHLYFYEPSINPQNGGLGGLAVSMLASGTQDRGFAPGRSRRIFRAKKSSACLPSEAK